MLQIRKILLRGDDVKDAVVELVPGANVLAGESDTGKSYLVRCLDFILGAEKLEVLEQTTAYRNLYVEFENNKNEFLTLMRSLEGGRLSAFMTPISDISGIGQEIYPKRAGKSVRPDITSTLFQFANIPEAQLRKNVDGVTQRLSVRTLAPLFLIDEVSIIDTYSPVVGRPSFNDTALKRTLSYLLTGVDDKEVIATEPKDFIKTRIKAKLEVVVDMLLPLEAEFKGSLPNQAAENADSADKNISGLSKRLNDFGFTHGLLQQKVHDQTKLRLKAESQLLGIGELLNRYELLNKRYTSDLQRLDFITEGARLMDALQDVNCPLCDQMMPNHDHPKSNASTLRQSAIAEASKINAHKSDLAAAILDIEAKRNVLCQEKEATELQIEELQKQLDENISPKMKLTMAMYEQLVGERTERETRRLNAERWISLLKLRNELERDLEAGTEPKQKWNGLSAFSLHEFCKEIEGVLREWTWSVNPRVEFDEKIYDIVVDGQPRKSHGKGVRAILYSAFSIGLMRYCAAKGRPHPGVVVIDSPLTSFKKKSSKKISGVDGQITAGVEEAFWNSLKSVPKNVQIIVIENKEPPADVTKLVHYEWFAGGEAKEGRRVGLIP